MASPAQMKFMQTKRDREKRRRLVMLVQILQHYLRKHNMTLLQNQVQKVIRDCHAQHLRGLSAAYPLADVIETRLKSIIDRNDWTQVNLCFELYMTLRRDRDAKTVLLSPIAKKNPTNSISHAMSTMSTGAQPTSDTCAGEKKDFVSV